MECTPSRWFIVVIMLAFGALSSNLVYAERYELTRNNLTDPKAINASEVSLYGIKLGDPETKAIEKLVEGRIAGMKAEQEGTFIHLVDQGKPTGPIAGVRIIDGKVDLIWFSNRFAHKTRGIFRNVLSSESLKEIREILGPEDYGDENVLGAKLVYEQQGFVVNYTGRDINVEFEMLK